MPPRKRLGALVVAVGLTLLGLAARPLLDIGDRVTNAGNEQGLPDVVPSPSSPPITRSTSLTRACPTGPWHCPASRSVRARPLPRRCCSDSRTASSPTTTAGTWGSPPLPRSRRRRWCGRPVAQRSGPEHPVRQGHPDRCRRAVRRPSVLRPGVQPVHRRTGSALRDLELRSAQSLEVLVRPRERFPVDRRRRSGFPRGDQPRPRRRGWPELRLVVPRRPRGVRREPLRPRRRPRRPGPVLPHAHRRLRGHRGTCLPWTAPLRAGRGAYLANDYCSGTVWGVRPAEDGEGHRTTEIGTLPTQVTAFGADESGELYVVNDLPGRLHRVSFTTAEAGASR